MNRSSLCEIIGLTVVLLMGAAPLRAADVAQETKEQRDLRMGWWREARFGMFIHWGLYAIPGGEWNGKQVPGIGEWIMNNGHVPVRDYEQLAKQFNPTKFNAAEWVKMARGAGQKYIVITSKHHDGFCLWDSAVSDYDVMDATPFKRDILKELHEACKADGTVRLCFYYSIMDWHHPDAQSINDPNYNPSRDAKARAKAGYKDNPNFGRYVENYVKPQLKELITRYDPGVLWFDGEWVPEYTEAMGHDVYNYCRSLKADLIVNNRVGKSRNSMQGMSLSKESAGDFGTPEQQIPATGLPGVDWESCMTMNDTWGFKKNDQHWKSTETLVRNLVDIASKGGNYLLNVGPKPDGTFPEPIVERLAGIGKWMAVNGESIYGTGASPFTNLDQSMRVTTKPGTVYLHVFEWPKGGKVRLPDLHREVKEAYLLAGHAAVKAAKADGEIHLDAPAAAPDPIDSVIVLKVEGEGKAASQ